MKIGQKIIVSGYLIVTPIVLCISAGLALYNYSIYEEDRRTQILQNTKGICDGILLMQDEMENMAVYISINTDIDRLLRKGNAYNLNQDSRIWTHYTPIKMVEDMAALNGYIKTIAIYPENGLRPYLRGMDNTAHVATMSELKDLDIYQSAVEKQGKNGWISAERGDWWRPGRCRKKYMKFCSHRNILPGKTKSAAVREKRFTGQEVKKTVSLSVRLNLRKVWCGVQG